jgi:Asp-tRNA(Asn)/Glu-tRNA(Gln) amidotransferase A subunit family amidase
LQIIFTATTDHNDISTPIVRHLLAIAEKGDEVIAQKALDDWYLAKEKDYNSFAEKYPLNGELLEQDDKIKRMREWCRAMDVVATPTFFVPPVTHRNDGQMKYYQLPKLYTVGDLKNFFMA